MRKKLIDGGVICIVAAMLFLLNEFGLLEKHLAFALIPIVAAYFLGQLVERKSKGE